LTVQSCLTRRDTLHQLELVPAGVKLRDFVAGRFPIEHLTGPPLLVARDSQTNSDGVDQIVGDQCGSESQGKLCPGSGDQPMLTI